MPDEITKADIDNFFYENDGSEYLPEDFDEKAQDLAKDWRKEDEPSDNLWAVNSVWTYDDYKGRARFYEDSTLKNPLDLDLIITHIDIPLDEKIQISPHIGDSFGFVPFGKSPLQVAISALLIDIPKNFGKQWLIDHYKNRLRLSAVARTGKIPVLVYATHMLQGPLISMRITEDAKSEDTITVNLGMLAVAYEAQVY